MKQIPGQLAEAARWLIEAISGLSLRRDTAPIGTAQRVFQFVSTRAALVTQKKLYGYLKERMGMAYPKAFDDERFVRSINIAKMHVFAASLSDLTVHAIAHIAAASDLDRSERSRMALECFRSGLADNADATIDKSVVTKWLADFDQRLDGIRWEAIAGGATSFTESPKAIVEWAPIAEELKKYDRDIVHNSMRFAWNEIREDFRNRLDARAVVSDWRAPVS
ncbi:hypothetical protein MesoLjLc_75960 [Mesorhizobium sp. L-8-10]|uniref:hypothetical protein n=1 Tax=Mesorhizobium sp. L-8-10 TaxID=2744523 RepID=UPI0019268314|nr:hypothetical protein [Mesorhizobium sp. L-8-10]BCH35666.1 hypothetical protein MesoLjLc_75960 [Mesorhizobium sp. L-8-10]